MSACPLNHVVEGPAGAPAVVLLNSLGADLRMWEPQAAALRGDFRVVRSDSRGHGDSPVPPGPYALGDLGGDVVALLDRLEIGRASVCGVSLGGATALWLAAERPERVERLAVCFSSAHFGNPASWSERAELVRARGSGAVAEAVANRWLTPGGLAARPQLAAWMRAMIAATPAEGYAACCDLVGRIDLCDALTRVAAPTLVLSGGEDPATPPEHGRAIAAGISGARFEEVEGAAHLGNLERPAAVSRLLRDHLAAGGEPDR